jgi:hypothetical protein
MSSGTLPMVRLVPRGFTATADAYLTPKIREYLDSFVQGEAGGWGGERGGTLTVPPPLAPTHLPLARAAASCPSTA